jgi:hypothetical protein
MTKIVINVCEGYFNLSREAVDLFIALNPTHECIVNGRLREDDIPRHDTTLVKVVETLGELASGYRSVLIVKEVDSNKYLIRRLDGFEVIITPEPDNINWVCV